MRSGKGVVGKRRVGDMREKQRPVFQDSTKLESHSPRYPELSRHSHRGREVYDLVEEGGHKEVQSPPGNDDRQTDLINVTPH